MIRDAMNELISWKHSQNRKPLLLRGARQVGKTWLMREFGRIHYGRVAYINFDSNDRMRNLFDGDYDIGRIVHGLEIEAGTAIDPGKTLVIFDEVQEVRRHLRQSHILCKNKR